MDLANQEGLSLSESIRTHLEKQTNDKTPSYQPDKTIKEQASNENHSEEEQNKRDALKDWMKKQTSELEVTRQLKQILNI